MKDELKVEHYDASEIEAKKKKTLKRVTTGVGAAALVTVLGYYGLVQGAEPTVTKTSDTVSTVEKNVDSLERAKRRAELDSLKLADRAKYDSLLRARLDSLERVRDRHMSERMLGGNGAWFNSVIQFIG